MGMGIVLIARAKRTVNPAAVTFLGGGFLSFSFGNLFYVLHYVLRGEINRNLSASDIAWVGAFFFFIGAHQLLQWEKRNASWKSWMLAALIVTVFAHLIILYGGVFINILWGVPMLILSWFCGKGMDAAGREKGKEKLRPYYFSLCAFLVAECALFMSWGIGYVLSDVLVTAAMFCMGIFFYRENSACT